MKPLTLSLLVLSSLLATATSQAADGSWTVNSGDWSAPANWLGGSAGDIADGTGAVAYLSRNYNANTTITIDAPGRTVGVLNWGDTNNSHWLKLTGTNGGTLTFDNGANAAQWNIGAGTLGGLGSDRGLHIPIKLTSGTLAINNQSSDMAWVGSISAATSGTKIVSNDSTGSGAVVIGRNPQSGAAGTANSLADGAGVLAIHQNSATSALYLYAAPSAAVGSASFTGGLIWDQGNVFVVGGGAAGAASGVIRMNAEGGTFSLSGNNNASLNNTNIILNANVTLDASTGATTKMTFAADSVMTLTGNRTLNVLGSSGMENPINGSYVMIGGISDGGNQYNFTKEGSGILHYQGILDVTGEIIINDGYLHQWAGAAGVNSAASVTINNGAGWINNTILPIATFTLNNGFTGGLGSVKAEAFLVSEGTMDNGLLNKDGFTAALTKSGTGTVILNKQAGYTGATAVNEGRLVVNAEFHNSSLVTVAAGAELAYNSTTARTGGITLNGAEGSRAVLSGTGALNLALTLDHTGDTLAPGNSIGTMDFGVSQTWAAFTYQWEVNDFTGLAAGADFDLIDITGALSLTGGVGAYVLDITSLDLAGAQGDIANFSETPRTWTILTASGGITGFDALHWTLDTANFTSATPWAGNWELLQVGDSLVLRYDAVPEPGATTLGLLALGGAVWAHRTRRRRSA